MISLSLQFSSLMSPSSTSSSSSRDSTALETTRSLNISLESSTYSPVTGYFIYSTLVMYIKSFSTRGQTTLILISISSPPCTKGEGLDFVLRTIASKYAHSFISNQVCREGSLGTCPLVIGAMRSFTRVFFSHSRPVVLIVIFTLENYILFNIGNPIHQVVINMKTSQPIEKFKCICHFF